MSRRRRSVTWSAAHTCRSPASVTCALLARATSGCRSTTYHESTRPFGSATKQGTMGRLISVNVGRPRDVEWNGTTIHTAIWKAPVHGRVLARRLNLEGDGQADLRGHGGEQRAVLVYDLSSYRYWNELLG